MGTSSRSSAKRQATFAQPTSGATSPANLVVVRAGRNSLHPSWIRGDGRADFDLIVVAYEQDAPDEPATTQSYYFAGRKIEGYNALFHRHQELFDKYEYIALFDDDLEITKADINRLFAIGRRYRLDLFQPSLTWDSHFSYAATLTSRKFKLRFTNMVEMMCPVFRATYLRQALPLFGLGYELGIDLIWSRITEDPWFRVAIVDDVVVRHRRPVGASKLQHTFGPDGGYDDQIAMVLDKFQTTFRGPVTYAAVDRRGRAALSRFKIACASLWLLAAWRESPMRPYDFLRFVTDHTRHCLSRPINLEPIDIGNGVNPTSVATSSLLGQPR
jgi:hypothetical protein